MEKIWKQAACFLLCDTLTEAMEIVLREVGFVWDENLDLRFAPQDLLARKLLGRANQCDLVEEPSKDVSLVASKTRKREKIGLACSELDTRVPSKADDLLSCIEQRTDPEAIPDLCEQSKGMPESRVAPRLVREDPWIEQTSGEMVRSRLRMMQVEGEDIEKCPDEKERITPVLVERNEVDEEALEDGTHRSRVVFQCIHNHEERFVSGRLLREEKSTADDETIPSTTSDIGLRFHIRRALEHEDHRDVWKRILLYQAVDPRELQDALHSQGIKCTLKRLKSFMESEGIPHTKTRKRPRRNSLACTTRTTTHKKK